MRSDAIPIEPRGSMAVLDADSLAALFGPEYRARGKERVEIVRRGVVVAIADVQTGAASALYLAATAATDLPAGKLLWRGPKGHAEAPAPQPVPTQLMLPEALLGAWNLRPGQRTTVVIGSAALQVTVCAATRPCLSVDHSVLPLAGVENGAMARWVGEWPWEPTEMEAQNDPRPASYARVITENDVRRARMQHRHIRVAQDQIVTPAARALGEELGVFDDS